MKKYKHSTLPFHVEHEYNVVDKNGRSVASCGGVSSNVKDETIENKANAKFICQTGNSFYDLLELYEEIFYRLKLDPTFENELLADKLEHVIAKAYEE